MPPALLALALLALAPPALTLALLALAPPALTLALLALLALLDTTASFFATFAF